MMKTASATAIALMALAGLALASCDKDAAADTKVDKTKVTTAIKNDVHDLVESLNAKDVDTATTHDAANYVGMFHGAPNSIGPEQDKATTKQVVADPLFWVQLGNETVDVSDAGDMAVYRTSYQYRHTGEKSKKEVKELGNWVIGYKKQPNGAWKVAWNVISDTPPEPAAPEPHAEPAAKK